jgi:hypothetical protein
VRMTGGRLELGAGERRRPVAPPWKARLRAKSGAGSASFDVTLSQVPNLPDGWDEMFTGTRAGLTVELLFRRRGAGGELRWNFRHRRDESPVSEQLEALTLLQALSGTGELRVSDRGKSGRSDLRVPFEPIEFAPEGQALLGFLEAVDVIEKWANSRLKLPETIAGEEARQVAEVAHVVRNRGRSINWHNFTLVIRDDALPQLQSGGVIRVEQELSAELFGQTLELGYSRVEVTDYQVVSVTPDNAQQGYSRVRLEPRSSEGSPAREELVKKPTRAQRPPPPPKKRGGGRRGKRPKKRR